jgi:hypothetical protein
VAYIGLGSRSVVATTDTTGFNAGNWTNSFTSAVININVANYEMYHAVITSAPAGAQATVQVDAQIYSFSFPLFGSEWDPQQPLLLQPGREIYFLWNITASGTPPQVNCYFRYDPTVPGNHHALV